MRGSHALDATEVADREPHTHRDSSRARRCPARRRRWATRFSRTAGSQVTVGVIMTHSQSISASILALACALTSLDAQPAARPATRPTARILAGPDFRVNRESDAPHFKTAIAADPTRPRNLIGA